MYTTNFRLLQTPQPDSNMKVTVTTSSFDFVSRTPINKRPNLIIFPLFAFLIFISYIVYQCCKWVPEDVAQYEDKLESIFEDGDERDKFVEEHLKRELREIERCIKEAKRRQDVKDSRKNLSDIVTSSKKGDRSNTIGKSNSNFGSMSPGISRLMVTRFSASRRKGTRLSLLPHAPDYMSSRFGGVVNHLADNETYRSTSKKSINKPIASPQTTASQKVKIWIEEEVTTRRQRPSIRYPLHHSFNLTSRAMTSLDEDDNNSNARSHHFYSDLCSPNGFWPNSGLGEIPELSSREMSGLQSRRTSSAGAGPIEEQPSQSCPCSPARRSPQENYIGFVVYNSSAQLEDIIAASCIDSDHDKSPNRKSDSYSSIPRKCSASFVLSDQIKSKGNISAQYSNGTISSLGRLEEVNDQDLYCNSFAEPHALMEQLDASQLLNTSSNAMPVKISKNSSTQTLETGLMGIVNNFSNVFSIYSDEISSFGASNDQYNQDAMNTPLSKAKFSFSKNAKSIPSQFTNVDSFPSTSYLSFHNSRNFQEEGANKFHNRKLTTMSRIEVDSSQDEMEITEQELHQLTNCPIEVLTNSTYSDSLIENVDALDIEEELNQI